MPAGVTKLRVSVQASGGIGAKGGTQSAGGGGGGGGGFAGGIVTVSPGDSIPVTVGSGNGTSS